jgi:hypothetical protein
MSNHNSKLQSKIIHSKQTNMNTFGCDTNRIDFTKNVKTNDFLPFPSQLYSTLTDSKVSTELPPPCQTIRDFNQLENVGNFASELDDLFPDLETKESIVKNSILAIERFQVCNADPTPNTFNSNSESLEKINYRLFGAIQNYSATKDKAGESRIERDITPVCTSDKKTLASNTLSHNGQNIRNAKDDSQNNFESNPLPANSIHKKTFFGKFNEKLQNLKKKFFSSFKGSNASTSISTNCAKDPNSSNKKTNMESNPTLADNLSSSSLKLGSTTELQYEYSNETDLIGPVSTETGNPPARSECKSTGCHLNGKSKKSIFKFKTLLNLRKKLKDVYNTVLNRVFYSKSDDNQFAKSNSASSERKNEKGSHCGILKRKDSNIDPLNFYAGNIPKDMDPEVFKLEAFAYIAKEYGVELVEASSSSRTVTNEANRITLRHHGLAISKPLPMGSYILKYCYQEFIDYLFMMRYT